MLWKGKYLILDNFRKCLSDYPVDIQDIVRSAILDGLDISKYIDACKDNPFRLDQIRLGLKEGLSESLFGLSGDILYEVRKLKRTNNIDEIVRQISKGNLSDEHINYLLSWVKSGRSLVGIDLTSIPKNLLSVYDVGLSYDLDMSIFNGIKCSADYLTALVGILRNKRPVDKFLDSSKWDLSVVSEVSRNAVNHMGWYESWVDCLTPSMPYEIVYELRVLYSYMIKLVAKNQVSMEQLRLIDDVEYLEVFTKAAKDGMNLNDFIGLDKLSANSLYMSNKEGTKRKISGNIRGKRD